MTRSAPRGISREEAVSSMVLGKILCLFAALPPKQIPEDKYYVIVGFDEYPLLLKINSDAKFRKNHLVMRQNIYSSFLEYDSYLDCDRVWYILSYEEIVNQLMVDGDRIVGEILKDHEKIVVEKVNGSRSVIPRHRQIVADSFR